MQTQQQDRALSEADAAIAAAPDQAFPHTLRGDVLSYFGREAEAQAEYDRALTLQRTAAGHLARSYRRGPTDYAVRLKDIEEAIKLEPDNQGALVSRAQTEARMGEYDKALAHIQAVLDKDPDSTYYREARAFIYARAGKAELALADVEWSRAHTDNFANAWNSLCYDQAMWNLSLDKALSDCGKAGTLSPRSSAILDSRAFVLLRMERLDEAIAG